MMARFRIDIEYDGAPYAGWQRQADLPTVQQALETAILAASGEEVTLRGAGRTDAGVHATGQVAHFELTRREWDPHKLQGALNAHLKLAGERVAVLGAWRVDADFDARFSATARHYLYRIVNRRAPLALEHGKAWHLARTLDVEAMHEAAQSLVGKHDFTTFRSVQCQSASPVKTLDRLDVARHGEVIEIRASARSFLHNQVRSMVGSLRKIGDGSWPIERLGEILAQAERSACGPVAPPDGLYLIRVDY